jgi:hypothetical protein
MWRSAEELPEVREVAARLLPDAVAIADAMANVLHERIPELAADRDQALQAETRASCLANVGQVLRALSRGESLDHLVTPPEAVEYARGYVRRDLAVTVLLRAYRLGQAFFWERLAAALSEAAAGGALQGDALPATSAWLFEYVDRISSDLVAVYGAEREHWARTPAAMRAETARALLSGELRDAHQASRLLGYELTRRHHTGVVLWHSLGEHAGELSALERIAADAAEVLGASDSLTVLSGASQLWLWCSGLTAPDAAHAAALRGIPAIDGIRIAVGRTASDLAGFRRTHLEASAAARVALLAGPVAESVTLYDDVEVVSLLCEDLERARAFIRHELGELASSEQSVARLRETMLVLLEEGMSNSRAARRLYVHNNTVVYRAARAQELLGHRLVDRRIQVTAALMLAQTLGDAALPEPASSDLRP